MCPKFGQPVKSLGIYLSGLHRKSSYAKNGEWTVSFEIVSASLVQRATVSNVKISYRIYTLKNKLIKVLDK